MLSKKAISELRRRCAEHEALMATADRGDVAAFLTLMEQGGFLAAAVPHLLDEIERLQKRRTTGPPLVQVKFDPRGGVS